MLRLNWGTLICLLCVVGIVGCTEDTDRPETVRVTGTVTLNGDPLEGALVAFSPKGGTGNAAAGTTDASGKYTLTTFESGDGAVPGTYMVGVTKTEAADATVPASSSAEDVDAAYEAAEKAGVDVMGGGKVAETKQLLPAKYGNPTSSGFEFEVTKGGDNNFDLPLEG